MKVFYYESHLEDEVGRNWAIFYDQIIERVMEVLRPEFQKRVSQELSERACEYVLSKVKEAFCKNYLMVPPYLYQNSPSSVVALVISVTGEPQSLTAVHVTEKGDLKNNEVFSFI